jgi:predicted AlkP superfamily pyrophosphatase or phosphodiesterase
MNKASHSEVMTRPLFAASMIVLLALAAACQPEEATANKTPKALFIIVDGIPADVIESTPTPNIDSISGAGGYTRSWLGGEAGGETESPTVSAVGYMSLVTGTWSNKHNVYDNAVEAPDYAYWDIFRIAKAHDPALHTAIFSTWTDNRTKLLGDGLPEAGGTKLDYAFDGFELDTDRFPHDPDGKYIKRIDALVVGETARYVREAGPDLSWVYLEHTDDVAHRYGDGPEMTAAVKLIDEQVGQIWQAVGDRERTENEDWLFIVTTDHGRDAETGMDHGGQSERERTIWIATNSKKLNPRFEAMPAIVDILPSIATHMKLEIPPEIGEQLDGHSFID